MRLRRYWFEFTDLEARYWSLTTGCGVTAYDQEDALQLPRERIFFDDPLPTIRRIVEDVDVSTLDDDHVRPSMSVPVYRGVWFPRGYD